MQTHSYEVELNLKNPARKCHQVSIVIAQPANSLRALEAIVKLNRKEEPSNLQTNFSHFLYRNGTICQSSSSPWRQPDSRSRIVLGIIFCWLPFRCIFLQDCRAADPPPCSFGFDIVCEFKFDTSHRAVGKNHPPTVVVQPYTHTHQTHSRRPGGVVGLNDCHCVVCVVAPTK